MKKLLLLTIIGLSATSNSIYESQIIRNEHFYHLDFYLADSGWKEAAMWLENSAGPPATANPTPCPTFVTAIKMENIDAAIRWSV